MQVERTLVKSPPELWAEVSDVEALTRHLSRFGEIAITRVEPETKVAWEGEHARGTVELTASGWGTKVTLTAEEAEPVAAAPETVAAAVVEPAPADPAPEPADARSDDQATAELAVIIAADTAPEPARQGLLRRLMFWRSHEPGPESAATAETPAPTPPGPAPGPPAPPAPPAPDPVPPAPTPSPGPPGPPDPNPPQIRAELTEAALAETLDSLGQAHHRPFSRS